MRFKMSGLTELWKVLSFDALLKQSDNIIICIDNNGVILAFNKKAEDIYEWHSEEVIGKNYVDLCKGSGYQLPLAETELLNFEYTKKALTNLFISPKQTNLHLQWVISPIFDSNKNKIGKLLTATDITAHQKIEDNLKQTVLFLDNIINNLPHYIFWKDKNSVFLGCNKKFAETAKLKNPKDIIGKTDYDMPWSKEQSDIYIKDDMKVMLTRLPKLDYEETQRQADGTENVVLVSKVPIINQQNNQVDGILGIYTDITERKQMENHLRIAKEQAEHANNAKTDFIRNMEHDIRTPFNGIWGMANLLWQEEKDQQKKEYLGDIAQAAKELLDFCNDILDFTKTELNILPVFDRKFELNTLIDSVMAMEKPAAAVKGLDLMTEFDQDVPKIIIGDSYRLQRILINLISNAIKFTEKGFVKLAIKNVEIKKPKSIILSFYIEDSGIGIPEDKKQFIFEKFSRLNPANKG